VTVVIWILNRPSLAFESRDKLLVGDVDNLTGDKVFDVALRTAIEADLQQSPYASIFDKPQVTETLRLMRMDAASKIDEQLGCEICRFAGVRALLVPSIMSAGEAYDLQVVLVDPVRRRHVDRVRITARGKEDVLLRAIDELTERVRSRLGESLGSIEKASRPIAQVSTSSWDALNYFSMGTNRWQEGKYKEAAALIELALEKDAQFVDARGSLGLLYIQFLRKQPEGKELLRQALRDAEAQNLPQRDVLKLRAAIKHYVEEDLAGALEQYRIMQELFPDFMPPWNNAGMILRTLGRYDEAAAMYEKASEVAPRNSIPLLNLWFTQMNFRKDPKAGEAVARHMVELSPDMAYSHSLLGYSLAAQERFEEAEKELRRVIEIEPTHVYGLPNLAHVLLAAGRAAEAVPVYKEVLALGRQGRMSGAVFMQAFDLALALRESGQVEEARRVAAEAREALEQSLKGDTTGAQDLAIFGMIEVVLGRTPEAEEYLRRAVALGLNDYYTLLDAAKLCALLGRKDEAIAYLKKAQGMGSPDYFFPVISTGFENIRKEAAFRAMFKLND
jgi:tetratricopeptide (TPR) repeat protein